MSKFITDKDLGDGLEIRENKVHVNVGEALKAVPITEVIFPRPASNGVATMDTSPARRKLTLQGKFGYLHLDFTARITAMGRIQQHWPLTDDTPLPTTLIEAQTHDGGTVFLNPNEKYIRAQGLTPGTRYIVDLIGFWNV